MAMVAGALEHGLGSKDNFLNLEKYLLAGAYYETNRFDCQLFIGICFRM